MKTRRWIRAALVIALTACGIGYRPSAIVSVEAQDTPCQASTALGAVVGVRRGAACAYLGVPYAAAPVGALRWRPPQPRARWAPAVLNTTVPAPACPQINPAGANAGTEDCLTLNVWTPATHDVLLPVLVWMHAGAFLGASSNFAPNDGQRFAEERNAVVVAPNYRLGAFGFLAHSALTLEDPGYRSSGNFGLLDQRAALQWVRANIAAFGGDPGNVTLAGSSAGGVSTGAHLVSRDSRGLFHRAIMQSGNATARWPNALEAEAQGSAFADALGCTDQDTVLLCLRSKSRDQVLLALSLSTLPGGFQQFSQEPGRVLWGPVVDGVEVEDQPRELYRRGLFARVPIIIGSNRDDGWTFVDRSFPAGLDDIRYDGAVRTEFGADASAILHTYPITAFATPKEALARLTTDSEFVCEARRIARVMHHEGAPVYVYSLEYSVDPVNRGRAFHGLDPNLVFGNNFAAPSNHVLTSADLVVYDAMSTFWRRFMETGDPNPRGHTHWPPYRPRPFDRPVDASQSDWHFVFGDRLGVSNHLRDSQCNFWESFNFRSVVGALPAAAR
jgi:para-nitrobenzyl esterase